MPLNFKKVTTEDAIRAVEEKIAYFKRQIANVRTLAKHGDKKALLEWLHDAEQKLQKAVNDNAGNPSTVRLMRAASFAGELRGIKTVINLFENTEYATLYDEQQKLNWEGQLKSLKELPTRKDA